MPDKNPIRIKPILALICDDVRQENNGKPFILGIYTAGITLHDTDVSSPIKPLLPLSIWIVYEASEAGRAEVEFQLVAPNPERKIVIQAVVEFEKKPPSHEILTMNFGGLMIPVEQEGDIKILFKHKEDTDWVTLRATPVTINPSVTSNATVSFAPNVLKPPS